MGEEQSGSLGVGELGAMSLGFSLPPEGMDTTMALGLTYYAMLQLLNAKALYMANWTIGLYALPTPFTPTSTASDFTSSANVPTFTGYSPQPLGPWSAAFLAGAKVQKQAPLVVWTPGNTLNPGPVYGFYVLDAGGNLVGAQDNPAGPTVVGGTLQPFAVFPIFREQAIA
jgi:hypothetical protein